MTRSRRKLTVVGVAAIAPLLVAGCGSSSTSTTATQATTAPAAAATTTPAPARGSGPVDVDYAGSLQTLMNSTVGPAFGSATGYTFTGMGGDSGDLANEIKAKTVAADIFISANPSRDVGLEGAANGSLVTWYATFATSPLVLGYDPSSKFAADLTSKPWYQVVDEGGFLLGRTDPTTDPKGALAVTALDDAATMYSAPALSALATSTSNVFAETSLVGRLQAGQLDAGFFYGVEAASSDIKTVPLTGVPLQHATYTITIPADAPHPAAAAAFVEYLLGPTGSAGLTKEGLALTTPPTVSGTAPAGVASVLSGQ